MTSLHDPVPLPPEPMPSPGPERFRRARLVARALVGLALAAGLIWLLGKPLWEAIQGYREVSREAESSAPIGYVGVSLRRTYFDKPLVFFDTGGGRKRLWAAKGPDGQPEYYDVSDAAIDLDGVSGGFGRDSIPGIDYPLYEAAGSRRVQAIPARHEVIGLSLSDGPRAYPRDLLRKIEVVNDQAGDLPFLVVHDRQSEQSWFYDRRIDGKPITLGTTGYALGPSDDPKLGTPLLYDRKTRSLWLPSSTALDCVSGALKGKRLALASDLAPELSTWSEWLASHPRTQVLMGSSREGDSKPIPSE